MAVYFLEKSPTYKQQTSPEIYRRREVVAQFMQDNYKVRKFADEETLQQVVAKLSEDKIEITKSTYQADKVLLRTAYLWLVATNETEKERLAGVNSPSAVVGLNCLRKDGILSWEQLGYGSPKEEADAEEEEVVTVPVTPPRLKLADFQAGQNVLATFSELVSGLEDMLAENEALKCEVTRLTVEAEPLKNRAADDQRYIELVESELTTFENKVRELREAVRKAQSSAHADTLETIAEQHPEIPQLTIIVQKLREVRGRQDKTAELIVRLPTSFTWLNDKGVIEYRDQFLKALEGLRVEEQEQVVGQLVMLATQGPEYASLHTRKTAIRLPYSPPDCLVSRGADDLRFSWKKNGHITVYWLFRKGDSRVRYSEQ